MDGEGIDFVWGSGELNCRVLSPPSRPSPGGGMDDEGRRKLRYQDQAERILHQVAL